MTQKLWVAQARDGSGFFRGEDGCRFNVTRPMDADMFESPADARRRTKYWDRQTHEPVTYSSVRWMNHG